MKICESCQHRIKYSDAFYCKLTGKLIAIDDFDCVNHKSVFKRTTPHECQQCGLCCQGRGDLWGDEESWPNEIEPDDCTAFDKEKCSCNVYDDRRWFCEDYPWDEWCERELKEKGLWDLFKK